MYGRPGRRWTCTDGADGGHWSLLLRVIAVRQAIARFSPLTLTECALLRDHDYCPSHALMLAYTMPVCLPTAALCLRA